MVRTFFSDYPPRVGRLTPPLLPELPLLPDEEGVLAGGGV